MFFCTLSIDKYKIGFLLPLQNRGKSKRFTKAEDHQWFLTISVNCRKKCWKILSSELSRQVATILIKNPKMNKRIRSYRKGLRSDRQEDLVQFKRKVTDPSYKYK